MGEQRILLISKDKLIEEVWQGRAVTDGSLGKCIEEVREALGPDARQSFATCEARVRFDTAVQENSEMRFLQTEELDVLSVVVEEDEESGATVPGEADDWRLVSDGNGRNHRKQTPKASSAHRSACTSDCCRYLRLLQILRTSFGAYHFDSGLALHKRER